MNARFVLGVALLVVFASGGRAGAGAAPAVITHRLADEQAIALHRPVTPTAVIGDTTRYVLSPPVAASIALPGVPTAARDGTLTVDVPCPAEFAGREAFLSVAVPVPAVTSTVRTRCPSAGATVRIVVPGVTPGLPVGALVNAVGLPERLATGWLSPRPGARLRAAIGLAGNHPGERPAPVRFRVLAEGQRKQPPLTLLVRPVDAAAPGERSWLDIDVPLDPARELGTFRLVFDAEQTGASAGFPVWGDPMVVEPAPAGADAPWNVLLVSIDTLRADQLGCYGNSRATSPAIDAVANAGTRFPVAVASAPWTLPSHVSMMTGLYPCAHGLVSPDRSPLNPAVRPLAAVLRPRAYATAAFTEDAFLDSNVFQRGFGLFRADPGSVGPDRVERTMSGARDWLRQVAGTPFFLFVHTYQVHAPIRVPSRYYQTFTTWDGPDGPRPLADGPPGIQELTTYDTAIRYTDDTLGGLLVTLDELDLARRTIVVVTSDHGEAFWEHDLGGHGKTVYEEEVRIPLVIRAPGLVEPGRRVPEIASLVDVLPTVLELLGVQPPTPIQGRSLASLIRAGTPPPTASAERIVFAENSLQSRVQVAVRGNDWKGMFEDPAPVRIFKLDGDPRERRPDESGALVETATAARRRFDGECTRTRDALTAAARDLPAPPPIAPDPARQERLRALGYAQ